MLCQKDGRVMGPCGLWQRPPGNLAETQTRVIALQPDGVRHSRSRARARGTDRHGGGGCREDPAAERHHLPILRSVCQSVEPTSLKQTR